MATANRNTSVSAASRIDSAISLGVRCRFAPSTIAIMRSRKLSPGFDEMRTTSQSDSTRVPPVTDERSPPEARTTGADSPVIADSSTDATPSMTSPSPGTSWPASTSTMSPLRSVLELTVLRALSRRSLASFSAGVSCLAPRRLAACALPRPSASASAKLANSTVNHSQTEIAPVNPSASRRCEDRGQERSRSR